MSWRKSHETIHPGESPAIGDLGPAEQTRLGRDVYSLLRKKLRRVTPAWRKDEHHVQVWVKSQTAPDATDDEGPDSVIDGSSLDDIAESTSEVVTDAPASLDDPVHGELQTPEEHPEFVVRTVETDAGLQRTITHPVPEVRSDWRRERRSAGVWFKYGIKRPVARRLLQEVAPEEYVPPRILHGTNPPTGPDITDVEALIEWGQSLAGTSLPVPRDEMVPCSRCCGAGTICTGDDCEFPYHCTGSQRCNSDAEYSSDPGCYCTASCKNPAHREDCPVCTGTGEVYRAYYQGDDEEVDTQLFYDSEIPEDELRCLIDEALDLYSEAIEDPPRPGDVLYVIYTAAEGTRRDALEALFDLFAAPGASPATIGRLDSLVLKTTTLPREMYRQARDQFRTNCSLKEALQAADANREDRGEATSSPRRETDDSESSTTQDSQEDSTDVVSQVNLDI